MVAVDLQMAGADQRPVLALLVRTAALRQPRGPRHQAVRVGLVASQVFGKRRQAFCATGVQFLPAGLVQQGLQMRQLQRCAGSAAARAWRCGMGNHDMHGPIVPHAFA